MSHRELASLREHLTSQRWPFVLLDFQGEMMGRTGEIYFAVIKPTGSKHFLRTEFSDEASLVDTATLLTECAPERAQTPPLPEDTKPVRENPAFILDMRSQAVLIEVANTLMP